MTNMRKLAALAMLTPSLALAHGGPEGHAHPHGLEGLALAAALGLALLALRQIRR
jgi:hypothetical protein